MTHDTTPPKRIWVRWPQPSGTGLAFSCQSRPPELRTEYILASEVDALVAAALEPVMNLLMEPVATHTDSDWLGLRHDLLVQVTSAPAAAALDKLIREAEARGMERAQSLARRLANDSEREAERKDTTAQQRIGLNLVRDTAATLESAFRAEAAAIRREATK